MKRLICLVLSGFLLLPLAGCTGPELYERLMIYGIGIDAQGEGYRVTVRSSSSTEEDGEELYTATAQTVPEAMNQLVRVSGRTPFYAHNYLMVFGAQCARRGLEDCMSFLVGYHNARPAVRFYVAESTAAKVLAHEQSGQYVRMADLQRLSESGTETGDTVTTELLGFYNAAVQAGRAAVMPVLRLHDETITVSGTAVFSGFQMVDTLTREETRGMLAVQNRLESAVISVQGTAVELTSCQTNLTLNGDGDVPQIAIQTVIETEILSGGQTDAAEQAAAQLQNEISQAIVVALRQNACDVFGFGVQLSHQDPARWHTLQPNWDARLQGAEITVTVHAKNRPSAG